MRTDANYSCTINHLQNSWAAGILSSKTSQFGSLGLRKALILNLLLKSCDLCCSCSAWLCLLALTHTIMWMGAISKSLREISKGTCWTLKKNNKKGVRIFLSTYSEDCLEALAGGIKRKRDRRNWRRSGVWSARKTQGNSEIQNRGGTVGFAWVFPPGTKRRWLKPESRLLSNCHVVLPYPPLAEREMFLFSCKVLRERCFSKEDSSSVPLTRVDALLRGLD